MSRLCLPGSWCAWFIILMAVIMVLPAASFAQPEPPPEELPPGENKSTDNAEMDNDAKPVVVVEAGQDIPVDSLLEQIGKMTGKSVIPAQQISGRRIKFVSSFSADYYILEAILELNGITLEHEEVEGTEMIKALTDREVRNEKFGSTSSVVWIEEPSDIDKLPKDNEIVTAIFHIKYADPTQVERTLTNRLLNRQGLGSIISVTNQPVIIARDLSREIKYYAKLIKAIDVPPKSVEMRVYTLKNAIASEVAQYLQQLAQGGRVSPRQPRGTMQTGLEAQFVADTRTNKLIVLTFPENFEKIETVIKELDEKIDEEKGNIHVYKLKHTDSVKMATALQSILSGQTPQRRVQPRGGNVPQQLQVIPSRVVAEEQNNSLLIEAEQKDYDEILHIIRELDVRRPQVLLEAAIIEVSADSTTNMGIELATVDVAGTGFRGAGGTFFGLSNIDTENLTKEPLGGLGATALVYKDEFNRIPFLLQMLRSNSDVNVLSSPRILTNDNEQGEIKVTDQVATATYIDPQNGASRTTFNNYQEAGLTLTITPHISSDNYLRLEIALKIEQFTSSPVAGSATPPPKTTREINGMVTVPDREIIVIGGLTSEEESESINKIPILGDIPIFGSLFRSTSITRRKTNLYVFLTPHIIDVEDEKFDSLKKISRRQLEDAELLGCKIGNVSQIMKDLPAYYAKKRSKAYLEIRETLQDIFGRDFKDVFVIERPKQEEFFKE